MRRFQQLIDGQFEDGAASFESIDPATGKAWALMPRVGAADVDRAVTAAHRALSDKAWRGLTATSSPQDSFCKNGITITQNV